jgi:ketol-acid reductoisomerase
VTVGVLNPTLDGRIAIAKRQFRLKVYGLNFAHGCVVRINGVPAPASVRKGMTLVVAKGGTSLKYMVPKGVPVLITVTNPDGGISNQVAFQR